MVELAQERRRELDGEWYSLEDLSRHYGVNVLDMFVEHPGRKACRGPCQALRATGRPYPFRVCGRPCMLPKNHDPNTEPHHCGDEEQHAAEASPELEAEPAGRHWVRSLHGKPRILSVDLRGICYMEVVNNLDWLGSDSDLTDFSDSDLNDLD